jgi:hypothetical protein
MCTHRRTEEDDRGIKTFRTHIAMPQPSLVICKKVFARNLWIFIMISSEIETEPFARYGEPLIDLEIVEKIEKTTKRVNRAAKRRKWQIKKRPLEIRNLNKNVMK